MKLNTAKTDPSIPPKSMFGRAGGGGGLVQAKISMVALHALHPRRDAADENSMKNRPWGANVFDFRPFGEAPKS